MKLDGKVAYATTKSEVLGFTKALATELFGDDIKANAIMPGYIKIPMVEKMADVAKPEVPESVTKGIADVIPMKRMGAIEK